MSRKHSDQLIMFHFLERRNTKDNEYGHSGSLWNYVDGHERKEVTKIESFTRVWVKVERGRKEKREMLLENNSLLRR